MNRFRKMAMEGVLMAGVVFSPGSAPGAAVRLNASVSAASRRAIHSAREPRRDRLNPVEADVRRLKVLDVLHPFGRLLHETPSRESLSRRTQLEPVRLRLPFRPIMISQLPLLIAIETPF